MMIYNKKKKKQAVEGSMALELRNFWSICSLEFGGLGAKKVHHLVMCRNDLYKFHELH